MDETELRIRTAAQREAHHALLFCRFTEICEVNGPDFWKSLATKASIASMKYRHDESAPVADHLDWFMGEVSNWLAGDTGKEL